MQAIRVRGTVSEESPGIKQGYQKFMTIKGTTKPLNDQIGYDTLPIIGERHGCVDDFT